MIQVFVSLCVALRTPRACQSRPASVSRHTAIRLQLESAYLYTPRTLSAEEEVATPFLPRPSDRNGSSSPEQGFPLPVDRLGLLSAGFRFHETVGPPATLLVTLETSPAGRTSNRRINHDDRPHASSLPSRQFRRAFTSSGSVRELHSRRQPIPVLEIRLATARSWRLIGFHSSTIRPGSTPPNSRRLHGLTPSVPGTSAARQSLPHKRSDRTIRHRSRCRLKN